MKADKLIRGQAYGLSLLPRDQIPEQVEALILLPLKGIVKLHDSGWGAFQVIPVMEGEALGRIRGLDVLEMTEDSDSPTTVVFKPDATSLIMDCYPASGLLRIYYHDYHLRMELLGYSTLRVGPGQLI